MPTKVGKGVVIALKCLLSTLPSALEKKTPPELGRPMFKDSSAHHSEKKDPPSIDEE